MPFAELFKRKDPLVPMRAVHFDLKGTPPTSERLLRLLEIFAHFRYNAVLMEWEDSFPWNVDRRFRSETAYSEDTIRAFIEQADRLGMEVIPLVQCLGHMETPLSVSGYEHLREVPTAEDVLNPLADGAADLVETMIDDVLKLLPEVRYFHLGGDEAWSFGTHPDTKAFIRKHGKGALYLHHVGPLLDKLNGLGIRPMLWHDMMREWDSGALRDLSQRADLVTWGYGDHPDNTQRHYSTSIIERFLEHDMTLWGGTAYKGGDGHNVDRPDLEQRQTNAMAWTEIARRYDCRGVVVTAWSRFSTTNVQTVPIDAALDSALNAAVILHDGAPPSGGATACGKALNQIVESEIFESCRDTMVKLQKLRDRAWNTIRSLREVLVTVSQDPRKCPSQFAARQLAGLRTIIQKARALTGQVRKTFDGLMERIWIDRYLAERLEPLYEEFAMLESRFTQLMPETSDE